MNKQYSVLMSVYKRERPEYLRTALKSILKQSLMPCEIVLICDGPLTDELEMVLREDLFVGHLKIIRLEKNVGLGQALAEGLKHCSCEWIARMDSDDIAVKSRCEQQMEYVLQHPNVDVLSGVIAEFTGDAETEEQAEKSVLSYKRVPVSHKEISCYIKLRNPMNHPCVMFRKSKVLEAGNYQICPLFEDYDLWVRMFLKGDHFANMSSTLLYMRVNEMHKRRGGVNYIKAVWNFWSKMYERGMISFSQYIFAMVSRTTVSMLPNAIRKLIYTKKLRDC